MGLSGLTLEQAFTLTVATLNIGTDTPDTRGLDVSLGFLARSVRIDNPTGTWLYIPSGNKYVQPYTIHNTVRIDGTQKARITYESPIPVQPAYGNANFNQPNEQAQIIFSEEDVPDVTGVSIDPTPFSSNGVITPGVDIDLPQSFWSRSTVIDNPTGQWLFVNDANQYIPPYTMSVLVIFKSPVGRIKITNQTPIGQQSSPQTGEAGTWQLSSRIQNIFTGIPLKNLETLNPSRNIVTTYNTVTQAGGATGGTAILTPFAPNGFKYRIIAFNLQMIILGPLAGGAVGFTADLNNGGGGSAVMRWSCYTEYNPGGVQAVKSLEVSVANDSGLWDGQNGTQLYMIISGAVAVGATYTITASATAILVPV